MELYPVITVSDRVVWFVFSNLIQLFEPEPFARYKGRLKSKSERHGLAS